MAVTLHGSFHEAKRDALPSCFAKPSSTMWTLTLALPPTLKLLGSVVYEGPEPHAVVLLSAFKGSQPKIVACEPPKAHLAPSFSASLHHPPFSFPILSLGLPLSLHHQETTYSLSLLFDRPVDPQDAYSLVLSSKTVPSLPLTKSPYASLFYTASSINLAQSTGSTFIVFSSTPTSDLRPFRYTVYYKGFEEGEDFCETSLDWISFDSGTFVPKTRVVFHGPEPRILRLSPK